MPLRVEHREVDAGDGLTLHVESAGQGPPLVLLHGFTGATRSWDAVRELLGTTHTVISIDLPGHGSSSAPPDPARYALPRVADDVARVLDLFHIERVALLGYSLGGRTALHFSVRHPDRLDALVVESASPGIADAGERAARRAADAALADAIERDGIEVFVRHWEALPLWESQAALSAAIRLQLRSQRLANDASGLANSLRGAGAGTVPALGETLRGMVVPTLLVAGALDLKYAAIARSLAVIIPDARLAIMAGAGHAVHIERLEEFTSAVRQFIDSR